MLCHSGTEVLKLPLQSLKQLSGVLEAQDMDERAGLIWLLDCSANVSDADLDGFMSYGQGIGPEKACTWPSLPCLCLPMIIVDPWAACQPQSKRTYQGRRTQASLS